MRKEKLYMIKRGNYKKLKKIKNSKEKYRYLRRKLGYGSKEASKLRGLKFQKFEIYHLLRSEGFNAISSETLLFAFMNAQNTEKEKKKFFERTIKQFRKTIDRLAKKKKVSKTSIKKTIQLKSRKNFDLLLVSGKRATKFLDEKDRANLQTKLLKNLKFK